MYKIPRNRRFFTSHKTMTNFLRTTPKLTLVFILLMTIILFYYWSSLKKISTANLDRFYSLTINDPLFYDPALDLKTLDNSIARLKSKEQAFLQTRKLLQKNERNKNSSIINVEKLFPIDFLENFSRASASMERFLQDKDPISAKNLLASYKNTAASYRKNAENVLTMIKNFIKENPEAQYEARYKEVNFLQTTTTLDIIRNDFKLIIENVKKLDKIINSRSECLYEGNCIKEDDREDYGTTSNGRQDNENGGYFISQEILFPKGFTKTLGPYLIETSCFRNKEEKQGKNQPIYLFTRSIADKPPEKISLKLADQVYYIDYKYLASYLWEREIAKIFLDKGIRYIEQNATNDYGCPDLTYQPEVLERARKDIVGEQKNYEMEKISQANKLWGLPYIIDEISSNLDYSILHQKISKRPTDQLYLLTSRLDYSIFYMPFAKSVWRIDDRLKFILKSGNPIAPFFETYASLKKKGYSDKEIEKFNYSKTKILREAIKNK